MKQRNQRRRSGREDTMEQKRAKGVRKRASRKAAVPRVVLVIDDDADWRLLVRDALAQSDVAMEAPVEVVEFPDGQAALRYLRREGEFRRVKRPALIYLDCEMPRVDGLALLECLRTDCELREIPAIMLTGVADEHRMREACAHGAAGYIVKPADADSLSRVISASAGYYLRMLRPAARGGAARRRRPPFDQAA